MALLADWWLTALVAFGVAAAAVALWQALREPVPDEDARPAAILRASVAPVFMLGAGLFALAVLAFLSISLLAIYFVIWWTVLFAVLPWGAWSQAELGSVEPGTEPAAPRRPLLVQKAVATSLISAVVFLAFYWLRFESGLDIADLPFLPEVHY